MAQPTLRGHQGQVKLFENSGLLAKILEITNVQVTMDSTFQRSSFVGQALTESDQSVAGWSGSFDCEVRNASIDDMIDDLITNNLNGIGVSDYTFLATENYADGTSQSYVYFDCVFKMSKTQAGLEEKMTKKIDFQCSGRQKL